jgi:hypothetical protein
VNEDIMEPIGTYPRPMPMPGYGTAATEERNYVPAIENVAPGITEIANQIAVEGESWISAISRAMTTVAMADYQRQILKAQLDRARQGLPPLQPSEYAPAINVGLSPQTRNLLIYGGIALVAVLLLRRRG